MLCVPPSGQVPEHLERAGEERLCPGFLLPGADAAAVADRPFARRRPAASAPGGLADAGLCVFHRGGLRPGVAGLPGAVENLPPGAPGGGRRTKLNPKENCLWIEKPRGGGPGLWWRR